MYFLAGSTSLIESLSVGSSVTLDDLEEIVGVVPEDAEDNGTQEEGNPATQEGEV